VREAVWDAVRVLKDEFWVGEAGSGRGVVAVVGWGAPVPFAVVSIVVVVVVVVVVVTVSSWFLSTVCSRSLASRSSPRRREPSSTRA
jgi:hypothetical protein